MRREFTFYYANKMTDSMYKEQTLKSTAPCNVIQEFSILVVIDEEGNINHVSMDHVASKIRYQNSKIPLRTRNIQDRIRSIRCLDKKRYTIIHYSKYSTHSLSLKMGAKNQ